MSHEYNDADWEFEVDSAQRQGTTGQTLNRRHGKETIPSPSDNHEPKDKSQSEDESPDEYGIPSWI